MIGGSGERLGKLTLVSPMADTDGIGNVRWLKDAGRIRQERRDARLNSTPQQRAYQKSYAQEWHEKRLKNLKSDPETSRTIHLRRRLVLRGLRRTVASGLWCRCNLIPGKLND